MTRRPHAAAPLISRRGLLRGTLSVGAVGAIGGVGMVTETAAAGRGADPGSVPRPTIASCTTWGAASARGTIQVLGYRPTKILIHHTDTANTTDYSQAHAFALARSIQQSHFARGWIDTGQHYTSSRGGYLMEGRHQTLDTLATGSTFVLGAHCTGQNSVALGIENEGTYTSELPPTAQWDRLIDLVAYLCQTYALDVTAIYGHRDFLATDCPGDALYAQLPALRTAVASRLGGQPPGFTWPTLHQGASGYPVSALQFSLRAHGSAIAADGVYGSGTTSAVVAFQQAHGLSADGVCGAQTWIAVVVTVAQGAQGDAVKGAQTCLNAHGSSLAVDGAFGSGTKAAVVAFQQRSGLGADGVVGPQTWCALVN